MLAGRFKYVLIVRGLSYEFRSSILILYGFSTFFSPLKHFFSFVEASGVGKKIIRKFISVENRTMFCIFVHDVDEYRRVCLCIANRLVAVISGVDENTDNRKHNARETVQAKINKYKNVCGIGRGDDDDDHSLFPNGRTDILVADYAEN